MLSYKKLAKVVLQNYTTQTADAGNSEVILKHFDWFTVISAVPLENCNRTVKEKLVNLLNKLQHYPKYNEDTGWVDATALRSGLDIVGYVEILIDKDEPLYFTGHKEGAAATLIAAQILKASGYNVVEWVGFGSPKIQVSKWVYNGFSKINYTHEDDLGGEKSRVYKHNYATILLAGDPKKPFELENGLVDLVYLYYNYLK